MRNVIFAINISLDGCCDHTKFTPGEEVYEYFIRLMRDADTFVYGRKTYQLMVPYWPDIAKNHSGDKAENEFAQAFGSINKIIVFSKTLDRVEDKNTSIVQTNPGDEILKFKQQQGKNMLLGGVSLPSQLMELGLVDEYHFIIHPIIAEAGSRLLDGNILQWRLQLKLVGSKIFKSGCVALHYVKG